MFEGNIDSMRVFEKNGIKLLGTFKVEWEGAGSGRIEGMHVLEWEKPRE